MNFMAKFRQDSTGNHIMVGSRVWFRGEMFTIRGFGPKESVYNSSIVYFTEEIVHTDEVPCETSIDVVQ